MGRGAGGEQFGPHPGPWKRKQLRGSSTFCICGALFSLFSPLFSLLSSFSRLRDHFDLIFEALGPLKRGKSMQRVIEFEVFGVFALARPPNPEKHPKSIPRDPQSTQNLSQKEPRGSQRRPESAQGAPPKRPNRTLRPPGSIWDSCRTPQDLILELPNLTFLYFWVPPATQQRLPVCVLCSLFSALFSLHPGLWELTRGLRTSTLGPNA